MERSVWPMTTRWHRCRALPIRLRNLTLSGIKCTPVPASVRRRNRLFRRSIKWWTVIRVRRSCPPRGTRTLMSSLRWLRAPTTQLRRALSSFSRLSISRHTSELGAGAFHLLRGPKFTTDLTNTGRTWCGTTLTLTLRLLPKAYPRSRCAITRLTNWGIKLLLIPTSSRAWPSWSVLWDKRTIRSIRDPSLWQADWPSTTRPQFKQRSTAWPVPHTRWLLSL